MLKLKKVEKSYGKKTIVGPLDLTFPKKTLTALIGPNGAGKSTLLAMMSRLLPYETGDIYLDGNHLKTFKSKELAQKLSILKQQNQTNLNLTVKELVAFGRFPYSGGKLKAQDEEKIQEALGYLGLKDLENQEITTLSGGQLQRAYIALLLAQDTEYIFLDEPINNLDLNYGIQMMQLLQKLVTDLGKTVIVVLHDLNFASVYADEIVALKEGKIFQQGKTSEVMTEENLSTLYEMKIQVRQIEGKNICLYF